MLFRRHPALSLALAFATLSGCAGLPSQQGYQEASTLVEDRLGEAPNWSELARPTGAEIPATPLSSRDAIRLAFENNPRVREEFARVGIGRAEFEQARRPSNPTFGYTRLRPDSGPEALVTQSLSVVLTDLLLLPSRKRFAAGELVRLQQEVAAALVELAIETETTWFEAASANQIAAMRALVATSAEASAELAQRFFDAGNISRLQLEQELAAAAQARIAAVRAGAQARRARADLAALMGLPSDGKWRLQARLPAPLAGSTEPDGLVATALAQRLDLAAARQEVALRETTLGVTRRWRWLGSIEVGYERERELDGEVLRGPTLALELPIFNQGQAAITRARAELVAARARLDARVLTVANEARIGLDRMATARDISESYRTLLLPRREAIVARSQEQANFMLIGVFELILAKQQQYDAYQEYLEAVRDYWAARAELRRAVGGSLPDDDTAPEPTIGVDAVMPDASTPAMDHSTMGHAMKPAGQASEMPMDHSKMDHSSMSMPSDTAGEAPMGHSTMSMPEPAPPVPDPHAGHSMPEKDPPPKATTVEPGPEKSETPEPEPHHHGDSP